MSDNDQKVQATSTNLEVGVGDRHNLAESSLNSHSVTQTQPSLQNSTQLDTPDNTLSQQDSNQVNSVESVNSPSLSKEADSFALEKLQALKSSPLALAAQHIDEQSSYYKPWVQSYPDDVPEFVDTHFFNNLNELFEFGLRQYGHQVAFSNMEKQLSYQEVGKLAFNFAAFLQQKLGLRKGDKIAIMLPNLMQFPVVFFGAVKAGLTIININPLYTPRELQAQLDNSDATAIVVISNYAHVLSEVVHQTKIKHVILTDVGDLLGTIKGFIVNTVVRYKGMVPEFSLPSSIHAYTLKEALKLGNSVINSFTSVQMDYDDIVLLQYTGGTTGKSKGAMLSHGNLISNVAQAMGCYGKVLKVGQETIVTAIPLYHIFALTVNFILFWYLGAKNILITDPRNVPQFVKTLKAHPEISALTGVNTLFNLLVSHEDLQKLKWQNLRLVIGGGAAVQSGVEKRFFEKTGLHILEGYGLTECSPLCAVCPHTTKEYTGSIGLIVPSTIARIVDIDGNEIKDLEHEGELQIKGPQVMHGYYKAEQQNELIFDNGYIRTGDIAKWMEGGYIKLIDRLKDMILVSGFNVFPSEIEDVVSRFNRVLECAVIGVHSEKTGEAVKLYIVKKDPALTKEEVKSYCRAYLTPYKVPHFIEFVPSLPKSNLGKVLRRKLREFEDNHTPLAKADNILGSSQKPRPTSITIGVKSKYRGQADIPRYDSPFSSDYHSFSAETSQNFYYAKEDQRAKAYALDYSKAKQDAYEQDSWHTNYYSMSAHASSKGKPRKGKGSLDSVGAYHSDSLSMHHELNGLAESEIVSKAKRKFRFNQVSVQESVPSLSPHSVEAQEYKFALHNDEDYENKPAHELADMFAQARAEADIAELTESLDQNQVADFIQEDSHKATLAKTNLDDTVSIKKEVASATASVNRANLEESRERSLDAQNKVFVQEQAVEFSNTNLNQDLSAIADSTERPKSKDETKVSNKSAGALALERLLSSQHADMEAALYTPNIHRTAEHNPKSQLIRDSSQDSREHLGLKRKYKDDSL